MLDPLLMGSAVQPPFLCSLSPLFPMLGAVSSPPGPHLSLHPVLVLQSPSLFAVTNASSFVKFPFHPLACGSSREPVYGQG